MPRKIFSHKTDKQHKNLNKKQHFYHFNAIYKFYSFFLTECSDFYGIFLAKSISGPAIIKSSTGVLCDFLPFP